MAKDTTVSERQFAKLVGASLSAVQDRRKAGGLALCVAKDERGRYRIDPVLGRDEWEASTPLRMGASETDDESIRRWRVARARLAEAQATQSEDELRRSRGELVEAKAIEERLAGVFGRCRNRLLGVPAMARQRDPTFSVDQLALLDGLLREALEELAGGRAKP